MCNQPLLSFVKPTHTDAAYTLDDLGEATKDMLIKDGFAVTLRDSSKGVIARTYIGIGHGLYEPAEATETIKQLVKDHTGIIGEREENLKQAKAQRRIAKSEAQMAEIAAKPVKESKTTECMPKEEQAPQKTTQEPETMKADLQPIPNVSLTELLQMNAKAIQDLQGHLEAAQVDAYPLAHYVGGSQHKAKKAREQLVEHGLIEKVGKGYVLTQRGKEANIATHVRSPKTTTQLLRYTSEVTKWFDIENNPATKPTQATKVFKLQDSEGNIYTVDCVAEFAREHNLKSNKLFMVRSQVAKSHKGFTLVK